ncbi:hypothetical protein RJ639_018843 [Escallonia herrerae]|uniref:Phytocyanin domain-containing protein n=1 Tax=Escallonia herrerae TaxID=1293975 RepID=A0AA89AJG6_9ASTE|nr:hypothetical protein RJ639_018843 [Escallonia herrerae]
MEVLMRKGGVAVALMVMMVGMVTSAVGHLYKVDWSENVNYTQWTRHKRFFTGDWLEFVFNKRYYSVFEVNKINYEQCNDRDFIKNITKGGRDVFNLTKARPFYFVGGGGYCFHGMKLAVNVKEYVLPPKPSPAKSGSPTTTCSQIIMTIMLVIVIAWHGHLRECHKKG